MRRPGVAGKVTAVNGSTITIASMGRRPARNSTGSKPKPTTFTVSTTSSTTFSKVTKGTVGDLSTGDVVEVHGATSNGTVSAEAIHQVDQLPKHNDRKAQMPARKGDSGHDRPHTLGTITAVNGSTLTIRTVAGKTVEVTTSSNTKVTVIEKISISDLAKGDLVRVRGKVSGTTVTATAVTEGGPAGPGHPGDHRPENGHGPRRGAHKGTSAPGGGAPNSPQGS